MNFRSLAGLSIAVLLANPLIARAHFPPQDLCQGMLLVREVLKDKLADRAAYEAFLKAMEGEPVHADYEERPQTIWIKKKIETESDKGPRYVLERFDGKPWTSSFAVQKNALQGDPRNLIKAYGIEVGRFFGFELVAGGTELIVPSSQRFNWAVKALKEVLENRGERSENFNLDFFESDGIITPFEFLQVFSEGKIPFSSEVVLRDSLQDLSVDELQAHTLLLHDLSYHTAGIFIPGEIVRLAQRQMKAFLDYRDFCEKKHGIVREPLFRVYSETNGSSIDNGTGNFVFTAKAMAEAKSEKEIKDSAYDVFNTAYLRLTQNGISPKERLLDEAARYDHEGKMKPVLEEFLKEKESDPEFDRSLKMSRLEFFASARRRRIRIEAAIRLIQAREKKKAGSSNAAPGLN